MSQLVCVRQITRTTRNGMRSWHWTRVRQKRHWFRRQLAQLFDQTLKVNLVRLFVAISFLPTMLLIQPYKLTCSRKRRGGVPVLRRAVSKPASRKASPIALVGASPRRPEGQLFFGVLRLLRGVWIGFGKSIITFHCPDEYVRQGKCQLSTPTN